jgi:hypothetical protein
LTPRGVSAIFLYSPALGPDESGPNSWALGTPFNNNSFEPIMKTTLETVVYGVTRIGGCKHIKLEKESLEHMIEAQPEKFTGKVQGTVIRASEVRFLRESDSGKGSDGAIGGIFCGVSR